ncbi:MAG: hypothetical protein SO287_02845 [Parabacteroides sp.]|nr:hypothetical protein [Parabacteroides sp.]
MKTTTSQQPIAGWLASLLLLIALPSWGQSTTITPAANRSNVHTRTQIIYVDDSRELYVPELRISRENGYDWYVHWYLEADNQGTIEPVQVQINVAEAKLRGGDFYVTDKPSNYNDQTKLYTTKNVLKKSTDGYWWAQRARAAENDHGCDASTIKYTMPNDFTGATIICDVSNNTDDVWNSGTNTYKEPTLLKRYKFIIRPASEIVGKTENFSIDFPKGCSTVNLSMPSIPQNYYWGEANNYIQGENFAYSINDENGAYTDFFLNVRKHTTNGIEIKKETISSLQVQQLDLSKYTSPVKVYIKAKNKGATSPVIATFTFNPIENANFIMDGPGILEDRKPESHPDLYEEIGVVDFDLGNATSVKPTNTTNVSAKSLPQPQTVYGFLQKDIASLSNTTSVQNQYGLFRVANETGTSEFCSDTSKKWYLWIAKYIDKTHNHKLYNDAVLYDRTYERTKNQYGYFYYIDASDDPGTLVDIPIDGTLCGNTELTVTAWIADMTRPCENGDRYPLPPNVNLILKGKSDKGTEMVLHQFTSGDALTNYSTDGSGSAHTNTKVNSYLMKWQQLCYRITIDSEKLQGCSEFHLEVQNNEPHTDGADYAIDDIRIYKSKPNIQVRRKDACDASTLEIKTPYATLLRNLGLQEGEINDEAKARFAFFEYEDGSVGKPVIVNKDGSSDLEKYVITTDIPTSGSTSGEYPYIDKSGIVYLASLQVTNTELKYAGEKAINSDEAASGKYWVMLITDEIGEEWQASDLHPNNDPCALLSEFIVLPSFTIAIETSSSANGIACQGSIANVTPTLWVEAVDGIGNPTGKVLKFEDAYPNGSYTFDWFLGSMDEYSNLTSGNDDLQALISAYRKTRSNSTASFSKEDILNYYSNDQAAYKLFNELLGDNETEPKLIIGDGRSQAEIRWTEKVVAIPYVPSITSPSNSYEFCTEPQEQTLAISSSPTMKVGFPNITYPDLMNGVPLRVGLHHLASGATLVNVPIQKGITFGMASGDNRAIGLPSQNNRTIYLRQGQNYLPVGTVTALSANTSEGGSLSLSFSYNNNNNPLFAEGEIYSLYIPFGEYEGNNQVEGSCEGYAILPIKVVPEYLTWQGNEEGNNVWYNDGMWKQSTKGELFFNVGEEGTDANGSDPDLSKAFTPLYFTKITIPEGKQTLALEDLKSENNQPIEIPEGADATENIQYDMAVDQEGNNLKVVPYYINKVDQIYFKPGATLMNQHLLTYNKAWVEFYLGKNQPKWMTSPLHATYAGDFYAPKENGNQDTPAFADITYNTETNSRWGLPFYQKAWNKGVAYSLNADGTSFSDVAAIKSNWSIEYNDVWVPYSIGKGFYVRYGEGEDGEKEQVKMRLPKADTNYGYETKSLSTAPGTRTNAYRLAGTNGEEHGTVTLDLSTVDGDDAHYLIGNPYMTYLDMTKFFEANTSLAKKYWTLEDGATAGHVVGTPDVSFDEQAAGYVAGTGTVAPMQAFFVELASNPEGQAEGDEATTPTKTIKFTPAMMAPTVEGLPETQTNSLRLAATNPMITLTATCGDLRSHATLLAADGANNGYIAAEDAVALIDSELSAPVVYSVAGSQAAQVNAVKEIRNVGLGVYAEGNREVTLTLSGLDRFVTPLSLYDAETHKSQRLEGDRFSLTVNGSSHGRYFLRSEQPTGTESIAAQSITIYSAEPGKVIIDALQPIRLIRAFRIDGAQERQWEVNSTHQTLYLPAGIYVIHVSDGTIAQVEKVIVR